MDRARFNSKTSILVAGTLCCLALGGCNRPKKPAAAPNVDGLRDSLRRTAEAALPAPSLVNQRVVIEVASGEIEAKSEEVKRVGAEMGATLLPGAHPSSGSEVNLLLSFPGDRVAEFARRVRGVAESSAEPSKAAAEAPGPKFDTLLDNPLESVLVEVQIQPKPKGPEGAAAHSGSVSARPALDTAIPPLDIASPASDPASDSDSNP